MCDGGVGGGGEGVVWDCFFERVVDALAVIVDGGGGGGDGVWIGFFVVDCCKGFGLVGQGAGGGVVGAHPVGGVGSALGFDDDVGALADAECDHVGGVGFDGDEVVGHDGHGVAVDGEALETFSAGVDESQAMLLAGGKFEFGDTGVRCASCALRDGQ